MKIIATILAVLVIAVIVFHWRNLPPNENALIENFHKHRSTFDSLKAHLQADDQLDRLASWGIQNRTSPTPYMPPQGGFSRARFDEYLSLLNEVHGVNAFRSHGPHSEFCVGMWGRGFAGGTEHISICWLDTVPGKQVSSIDNINWGAGNPVGLRQFFYRKIEGNWYLERDG